MVFTTLIKDRGKCMITRLLLFGGFASAALFVYFYLNENYITYTVKPVKGVIALGLFSIAAVLAEIVSKLIG